ncbi:glyoxalase superfamily protein [Chitinilyticum piscinae]|uniref:Glyoxalase-related protein domain-containing protein n=1 Tax=Chitinilyticum piscinae TaxID=2866724 RepID=A0A8J7K885_9NEIS|nr:glyoxalase superfamily protein [Chitinilyticum piscinae]MBE9609148.1 hypothetical protein [Chitinilyticum piscinae]
MRTFLDAKLMAKTLRDLLAQKDHSLSHSEALEIVAQQFGCKNWNILAAKIGEATVFKPAEPNQDPLPAGWHRFGTCLDCYITGLDPLVSWQDKRAAVIRHNGKSLPDIRERYATLMQTFVPGRWAGKKIALSAMLKSSEAESVQMWMRIDGPQGVLKFDNMMYRPLLGTTDWSPARIVLSVPPEAISISFGFFLAGTGAAWASNFAISEAVATESETTSTGDAMIHSAPLNLDFSETTG